MRGVVAVDHGMSMANPRENSAPDFCWCVSHTLRGVVPRASLGLIIFGGVGSGLSGAFHTLAKARNTTRVDSTNAYVTRSIFGRTF